LVSDISFGLFGSSEVDSTDLVLSPLDFSLFSEDLSVGLESGWSSFGGEPMSTVFISILELVVSSALALGLGF